MFLHPAPSEIVYPLSQKGHQEILQNHFVTLYQMLCKSQPTADATFETVDGMQRCLSGIPLPYHNIILGVPKNENWNSCIKEQITYFNSSGLRFVWYLDENSAPEFEQKLSEHGFENLGVFQGVIGTLHKSIPDPKIPENSRLERVEDCHSMNEFMDVVSSVFDMQDKGKELYKKFLWDAMNQGKFSHWIARQDGKVVSALSTLIDGNVVSFWNGASLPEARRQGFNTALRRLALKEAKKKGCCIGISYLLANSMAFGICSQLGYEPKWRFSVFVSPEQK